VPGLNGFPQQERLKRRQDFEAVYRSGRKRVGREFVCYVARREGRGRRMGLSVSRKVGGAVVRNRVKRLIREVYRTNRSGMATDVDIVVVARPAAAGLSYAACSEALRKLWRASEVLRG